MAPCLLQRRARCAPRPCLCREHVLSTPIQSLFASVNLASNSSESDQFRQHLRQAPARGEPHSRTPLAPRATPAARRHGGRAPVGAASRRGLKAGRKRVHQDPCARPLLLLSRARLLPCSRRSRRGSPQLKPGRSSSQFTTACTASPTTIQQKRFTRLERMAIVVRRAGLGMQAYAAPLMPRGMRNRGGCGQVGGWVGGWVGLFTWPRARSNTSAGAQLLPRPGMGQGGESHVPSTDLPHTVSSKGPKHWQPGDQTRGAAAASLALAAGARPCICGGARLYPELLIMCRCQVPVPRSRRSSQVGKYFRSRRTDRICGGGGEEGGKELGWPRRGLAPRRGGALPGSTVRARRAALLGAPPAVRDSVEPRAAPPRRPAAAAPFTLYCVVSKWQTLTRAKSPSFSGATAARNASRSGVGWPLTSNMLWSA
jgi:hypothetical protein